MTTKFLIEELDDTRGLHIISLTFFYLPVINNLTRKDVDVNEHDRKLY
jgi:hypothetical protein